MSLRGGEGAAGSGTEGVVVSEEEVEEGATLRASRFRRLRSFADKGGTYVGKGVSHTASTDERMKSLASSFVVRTVEST
jgi:hypothetical protein